MSRTFEACCGRAPDLPSIARSLTRVLRSETGADDELVLDAGELRFGPASARVSTAGRRTLTVVAERPEDELLALATALVTTFAFDGFLTDHLEREEQSLADRVFRLLHGPALTTAHLDGLLAEAGTEACALAREALAAGTPAVFHDGIQPTPPTQSLYGRREHTSRRGGVGSVDFEPAVRALCAYSGMTLARAQIDDRARARYFFEVFLSYDLTRVVACFGISRSSTKRDGVRAPDAPPWSRLDDIVHSHQLETPEKVDRLREDDLRDVASGLVAGLERTLAMRRWRSFREHAELIPAFPTPEAAAHLTEALDVVLAEPYPSALLVAIIEDALASLATS